MVLVNATKTFLPAFVNPLSARRYAIVGWLRVTGLSHGTLESEILHVVQVVEDPVGSKSLPMDRELPLNALIDVHREDAQMLDRLVGLAINLATQAMPDEVAAPPSYTRI